MFEGIRTLEIQEVFGWIICVLMVTLSISLTFVFMLLPFLILNFVYHLSFLSIVTANVLWLGIWGGTVLHFIVDSESL